jgi:DNA-binding XRE family transcriptional regulator
MSRYRRSTTSRNGARWSINPYSSPKNPIFNPEKSRPERRQRAIWGDDPAPNRTANRKAWQLTHWLLVRQTRKESKITQMELASRLQLLGITIDRSGIAKLESGRSPASDIEVIAIAKVLKVPIPWLFEERDNLLDSQ